MARGLVFFKCHIHRDSLPPPHSPWFKMSWANGVSSGINLEKRTPSCQSLQKKYHYYYQLCPYYFKTVNKFGFKLSNLYLKSTNSVFLTLPFSCYFRIRRRKIREFGGGGGYEKEPIGRLELTPPPKLHD